MPPKGLAIWINRAPSGSPGAGGEMDTVSMWNDLVKP